MVTRDLAKVETAGSSPVYRFIQRRGHPDGCPFSFERAPSGARSSSVSASLRSVQNRHPQDVVNRLSLLPQKVLHLQYFFCGRSEEEPLTRGAGSSLRFASVGAKPTSTGRCAPVYRFIQRRGHLDGCPFSLNKPHQEFEVRTSPLRSGPFKADIHRMS